MRYDSQFFYSVKASYEQYEVHVFKSGELLLEPVKEMYLSEKLRDKYYKELVDSFSSKRRWNNYGNVS